MALQWLTLVATIWLQTINGTNSNFPAYSSHLEKLLSISQLRLSNLAFASDAGKLFGWFSGIAAAHLPLWLVLLIGSLLGLIGYGLQYLFLTNHLSSLTYFHVFLLTVLAGNSICWINTVCYIVTIKNFPLDRQIAVGLSTSYVGLSAKIYTDIVDLAFPSSSNKKAKYYLLLNSVLPLAICVIVSPLVREIKNVGKSRNLAGGFITMFVITMTTGTFAVISSLGSMISSLLSPLVIVIGMSLCLLFPLVVPLKEEIRETLQQKCWLRERKIHSVFGEGDYNISTDDDDVVRVEGGRIIKEEADSTLCEVGVREEIGVMLMIQRLDFWLYYFVYLFGATLGLVYLNNLGQITESRGSSKTATLVAVSSSFGFFGRLIPSILDYHLSRSKYMVVSRPASMAAMIAPMSAAFFILVFNGSNLSLFVSTAIIGTCTGAISSISVSTTTELFGTLNFGVNHNVLVTNIPIGSILFGNLAAIVYRNNKDFINDGTDHHSPDGRCIGLKCYELTFIFWGCLSCFGTLLALLLHARTRNFYSRKI